MPAPLIWTESRDQTLCALRAGGRSWDSIAAMLGISRWAVIGRGRLVGARSPEPVQRLSAAEAAAAGREALAAGHPVSWGAITAGTLLDGMAYPFASLAEGREAAERAEHAPMERALEWAA